MNSKTINVNLNTNPKQTQIRFAAINPEIRNNLPSEFKFTLWNRFYNAFRVSSPWRESAADFLFFLTIARMLAI